MVSLSIFYLHRAGLFYDGAWKDAKQHGVGFVYTTDGSKKFLGVWEEGEQKKMRPTTFREIENLEFYAKKADIEFPEEDAGPAKKASEADKKKEQPNSDFEL
jgi:hypothetical protein